MKKKAMILGAVTFLFIGTASFVGCGNSGEKPAQEEAVKTEEVAHDHKHYQCPMDCEEGKVYEAEGSCPVCKMDLKEV